MSKKPVMAPTPFSAEEIRSASPEGRSWTFRRIGPDGAIGYAQTTFLEVDAMEARYRTEQRNASGDPIGDATVSTSTWEGFRQDAEFPAAVTTVEAETLDTDLGRFDVRVYRVAPDAASGPTRVLLLRCRAPRSTHPRDGDHGRRTRDRGHGHGGTQLRAPVQKSP